MRVVNAAEKHVVAADEGMRSLVEVDAELADALYLNVAVRRLTQCVCGRSFVRGDC
jgi:hypothetical protein